jgi:hypothetical protein
MCCIKVLIVNVSLSNKALKGHHRDEIKRRCGLPFLRAASLIQRLGIGYDRTGTVAMANMSCGEQNQSTGGLHDGNAPRAHRSTAVYPNMLCNLLCIRHLHCFYPEYNGSERKSPSSSRRGLYGRGLVPGWSAQKRRQASQSGTR